jgi:type IV pilus assembly protein PilM
MSFATGFRAPAVGLDIGSSSVRGVALQRRRAGWSLVATGEAPVKHPDGPSAFTVEPIALSEAIRQLFDTMGLRRAKVAAALTGHSVIVKRLTLPAMSASALAEAIPWEAEQYIPFDLADVQLDYQVLNPGAQSVNGAQDVLLVAAKKDRIEDRTGLINQAGQQTAVLDVEAFALANAYQMNYPEHADELTALLHVGRSATVACLLEHGQLVFTRDISIGGRLYGESLQREFGVDADTAERLKSGQAPPESREQVASVLRDTSSQLVLEIRKTVDFYRATSTIEKVSRVMLSGGACEADGLSELLSAEFSAPVEICDPFRKVSRGKSVAKSAPLGPAYAVAVGLAMRREGDR